MRIECPSCNAAYDVPPERLTAGRVVKCVRCAGTWTPVEAEPVPPAPYMDPTIAPVPRTIAPDPGRPAEPPPPEPAARPAARHSRAPLVATWLLSIAVLAALGWAAIDRRAAVMQAWPPSTRAYSALGLAAPPH